ncbi:cytochrome c biogenesis protein [Candidatus Gracilibacteria bacterium]|nr:cytochrome c biogenesis protein [Candidatus Gracilibacteria bacterium]
MRKIVLFVFLTLFLYSGLGAFAQDYILFYGNGCPHCAKVENFFDDNKVSEKFDLVSKEIYFNKNNLVELQGYLEKLNLDSNQIGVPFLVINSENECSYINGDGAIIDFFDEKLKLSCSHSGCQGQCNQESCPGLKCESTTLADTENKPDISDVSRWKFFGVMLPAALSDSINPCAFAVMLLLISSILVKTKNKRKALFAGGLFVLAVFISYFSMGLGLFTALATSTNTYVIKLIVGILGIVVGLANLKDFFWYGKGFVMEVPFAWRPKMASLLEKVTSPWGAFIVGFIVSLFLLPCTSGPYFTILGYLASESQNINTWGYIYLLVYNTIFILPMIIIALLVGLGFKSAEELAAIKKKNTKLIHLIVGFIMLGLGIYVLLTM